MFASYVHFYVYQGFDPWNESAKGLAEIIEKESTCNERHNAQQRLQYSPLVSSKSSQSPLSPHQQIHPLHHTTSMIQQMANIHHTAQHFDNRTKQLPPGFMPNHIGGAPVNQSMSGLVCFSSDHTAEC